MEGNDLGVTENNQIIVVLEGVLCVPVPRKRLLRADQWEPATTWSWNMLGLKQAYRWTTKGIDVEVITFLGEEVADDASDFLNNADVSVGGVVPYDYNVFCSTLVLKTFKVLGVYDSDPDRIQYYGQRGILVPAMGYLPD